MPSGNCSVVPVTAAGPRRIFTGFPILPQKGAPDFQTVTRTLTRRNRLLPEICTKRRGGIEPIAATGRFGESAVNFAPEEDAAVPRGDAMARGPAPNPVGTGGGWPRLLNCGNMALEILDDMRSGFRCKCPRLPQPFALSIRSTCDRAEPEPDLADALSSRRRRHNGMVRLPKWTGKVCIGSN